MLNSIARATTSRVMDPIGRGLLRIGISPDVITVVGTIGAVAGSVFMIGTGNLFWGTMVVTACVLFDLVDGAMARARGYGTDFGVVLDASCDRIADGALFGAVAFYCFTLRGDKWLGVAALICLVAGQVISYVKARADSVELKVGGALAERAERNILGLVGVGLAGLGLPLALPICLWILTVASALTVVQRLLQVRTAYRASGRQGNPISNPWQRPASEAGQAHDAGETGSQDGPA
jgi:CDP-diacylglycerol--glycerol-3-phosphate 3-phosphatidyltransferase